VLAATGLIVAPAATWPAFAAGQVSFGSVAVGSAEPQDLIVRNGSSAIARLGDITATGDFWAAGNCPTAPAALGPGAACTLTITFRPTGPGLRTGSVTMAGPAGIQHTALLTGTGTAPTLAFDHDRLDFGGVVVGGKQSQPLTIRNSGSGEAVVSAMRTTADFAVSGSCKSVGPAQPCVLTVGFLPSSAGPRTGLLEVVDGAGTIHSVALAGSGSQGVLSLDTNRLDFGPVSLRVPVPARSVKVSNRGTSPLSLGAINAVGDFTAAPKCPPMLNPTESCVVGVSFSPLAPGPRTGALLIPYGAGSYGVVQLAALVQTATVVVPATLDVSTKGSSFTLSNRGPGQLLVSPPALLVGADLRVTSNCSPSSALPAGGSCIVTVNFAPNTCATGSDVVQIANSSLVDPVSVLARYSCIG